MGDQFNLHKLRISPKPARSMHFSSHDENVAQEEDVQIVSVLNT